MSMNSSGASLYAKHPTIPFLFLGVTDSTSTLGTDPINFCFFRGNGGAAPSADVNTYHHACIAQVIDDTSSAISVYINTGTYTSPSWTELGNLPPGDISLTSGQILVGNGSNVAVASKQYGAVSVVTNGATAVPLFSGSLETPGSLTGVVFTAADDANGTITVTNNGVTIATIVKGSQGSVKGSSIAASAFISGGSLNVVSTSGNGTLTATFITG
jgi:hypothetical protein